MKKTAFTLILCLLGFAGMQAQSLKEAMKPAVKKGGFKMDGYILWCPSVIKVGKVYHMFASRWPEKYGLAGWTKYSEVVRATSSNLYGPYSFQEVVLQKREGHWDNDRAHNPKIVKAGKKFVLYYISSANETGYAWADAITGPWHRTDSVAMPFSNPAPLVRKDGSVYVFGRKAVGKVRIAQAYEASAFDKPYKLVSEIFNVLPDTNQLEDPTIWWASGQYNVLLSDFNGDATGVKKAGAEYYSKDGVHYDLLTKDPIYTKEVKYDDGSSTSFRRRERPFVFVNESGAVTAFFSSCLTQKPDGSEQSWIEVQPVSNYVPKAAGVFGLFSEENSPEVIGRRIAERYLALPYQNFNRSTPPKVITYPETCTWYGALSFAKLTRDASLKQRLIDRFQPLLGDRDSLLPKPDHVDYTVFGAVPFEIYMQNNDKKYLELGKRYADRQWGEPQGPRANALSWHYYNKGMSWQTRMWIDDMFMITAVQSQAYRATGDQQYINHAAKEMVLYLDSLQRPNGLFYHAPDVPYFWGRGDGWMAAGMSELLRSLPKSNPDRARIMEGYQSMMQSLLKYQATDGMWRQLIDDPEAWKETSCTGMFAFAFITGVKEGWLDAATYGPAARKAWLALIKYINPDNDITDVCEGTNKKNDRQYYLNRKRNTGDLHGQAPLLWCANALLR